MNREFVFDLDAAANYDNALLPRHLHDALNIDDWPGKVIWLNPPYGRMLAPFIKKAAQEADKGKIIVALIPARVRAAWWHEFVIGVALKVRCVRKRPKFLRPDGSVPKYTMSCDSVIVVWNGKNDSKITRLSSFVFSPQ